MSRGDLDTFPRRYPDPWRNEKGAFVHPDAPGGGAGPGYFCSAGSVGETTDPFSAFPHPDSPAGRNLVLLTQAPRGLEAPILPMAWGKLVEPDFRRRVWQIVDALHIEADWLMAIMAFETGRRFRANTVSHVGGPVGLIQFTEDGARAVGKTKAQLAAMTNVGQLAYVEKFLKLGGKRLLTLEDLYMAVHYPVAVGKPNDTVLYRKVEHPSKKDHYQQNAPLDQNHDGKVTRAEAAARVRDALQEGCLPKYFG